MTQPPNYGQLPPGPPGNNPPAGYYGPPPPIGPVGKVRSTGLSFLWFVITFGIYGFFWWGYVHAEMKRHRGATAWAVRSR